MNNKVGSRKTSTNQLQQLKPEDNLPPEQPTKKSWSRRFVQKIIDSAKWIKDLITFKRDTKIITRKIDTNYIEPIEKKELNNIEFEQMVKQDTFSNEVFYNINGNVTLENIKNLPQHVKIFGDCDIKNSPELKKLSSDFIITGDVNFDSCSSLKMNADDSQGLFYINGELVANNCNNFDFINSEKKVSGIQGPVTLNSCDSFSYLPAGINNDVNIINCKNFKKILAGNYQNLKIEHCNLFSTIQPNVVTENLILNNNKKFTSFPDNLTVKNLSIISCPIKSFVSKITILEDLLFESCEFLKNVHSDNVKLEGNIIIDNCQQLITNMTKLRSWPTWICSYKFDGSLRCVQILGNYYKSFSYPRSVKLESLNIDYTQSTFSLDIDSIIEFFASLGSCSDQITYPYISQNLSKQDESNLCAFLKKIANTKDYMDGDRKLLGKQIVSILPLFQEETDPNITKKAMKIVKNNVSTYRRGDKFILDLDDLIMLVQQKEAQESGNITKIMATSKHKIMIEISDSMAKQHKVNQTRNILKARLQLRELFGMPIGISSGYCNYSKFSFSPKEKSMLTAVYIDDKITADFIESGSINWFQIEKCVDYYKLPVICADTQLERSIPPGFYDKMVKYKGHYYSYDAFVEEHKKSDTELYTKDPIDMSELYRVDYKDVEDNYIEEIETKELTNIEFEDLLESGEFSNNVHYMVTGNVNLNHYHAKYLPQHVTISGDFELKNALKLKHLPYDFTVTGNSTLESCINFRMRDGKEGVLNIQKQLTLIKCPAFTKLPTQISFDVKVIECNNFDEVLSGNYKDLIIEKCENFAKIHPNTVTENLTLTNNKKFISFPDDLTVTNLNVVACPIESFTSKITILEDLLFKSCENLKNIQSSNVQLEGGIIIDSCQQLITNINNLGSWPEWICSPKSDGSLRDMQILGHYRKVYGPAGVNLISLNIKNIATNYEKGNETTEFLFSLDFLIEYYSYLGNCRDQITYPYINPDLSETDKSKLFEFLLRMQSTYNYNSEDKHLLSKQIVRILPLFQKETDPNITKKAMEIVESITKESIGIDQSVLILDDLFMLVKLEKAKQSQDITKIRAEIEHKMVIDISDSIARDREHIQVRDIRDARLYIRKLFGFPVEIETIKSCRHDINFSFSKKEYAIFVAIIVAIFTDKKINEDFIKSGDINWFQIGKYAVYYKLPVICADTQPESSIPSDFYDKMVKYKGRYYSYDYFLEWYKKSSEDDFYAKEQIDMSELYRVDYKDVEDNYIEATETKELTNAEFEDLLASGEFSNNVHYMVNGNVNLNHCYTKYLPQHITISGDFELKNALELKHLPYDFKVTGNATLENCINFIMRDGKEGVLDIQKQLTLIKCPTFTELPQISFDVHISECNNFKGVLSGNYKNLTIEKCENFAKIHPNTVTENLTLIDNKKFISFSDNLTVKNLSVIACPIKKFTSKITILEDLLFESCNSLQNIRSPNVKTNGNIIVNNCKHLELYSEIKHFEKLAGYTDVTTFSYIYEDLSERDQKHLLDFLKRIRRTEDYQEGDKKLLAEQILRILPLFKKETDPTIRKTALEIVEYSVSSCGDRIILALDDLFMLVLQKEAQESGDITKIRAAMKHNMVIGLADSISRKYKGDQIENVLKARLEIRKRFNLPIVVQSMTYGDHASFRGFSNQNIKEIQKKSTDKELDKFIESGKSNWNEFQKTKIFLPKFEDLPIKPIDKKEMPECCITNMVYDEMVEYNDQYYGYETLLTIYRNKQRLTDRFELVDPTRINKIVLTKDANT
jgi:hypothetical protein